MIAEQFDCLGRLRIRETDDPEYRRAQLGFGVVNLNGFVLAIKN